MVRKNNDFQHLSKCHADNFPRWHAASYNLRVTSSNPYRRLSLGLISLLMGLLAIGPFLHAHYGLSLIHI